MSQSSAREKKREGTRKGPEMVKVKRRNQGLYRQVTKSKSQGGFPHPLLPTPLDRPIRGVTRGCRQCSQGTIGGSRLQGLGGRLRGKTGWGSQGRDPPRLNRGPSSIRSGRRKEGGGLGRRGGAGAMPEQQKRPQGPVGVCDPSGSPGQQNQFKSNPGKIHIQRTEGALYHIKSGDRKPGIKPSYRNSSSPEQGAAGAPQKRGVAREKDVVGQSLGALQ